ncbi:MAG: NAD(P)/FAD-dependent oxidoreductase [Geitlerinemataceae cyanobacterium]
MTRIAIAGCGIIGAILAYELSRTRPGNEILVLDRQPPARGSTGAALGLTIGALSLKKPKSRAWRLRRDSLKRYASLVPELIDRTGLAIPCNPNGILKLCTTWKPTLEKWETLSEWRRADGFRLEVLEPELAANRFPTVNCDRAVAAIHSIDDFQVEPVALAQAAIAAAKSRGVTFDFDARITGSAIEGDRVTQIRVARASGVEAALSVEALFVTAGAGSAAIAAHLSDTRDELKISNVLGQALHVQPRSPLDPALPVVTCNDVHIVPRCDGTLWVGATVEYPADAEPLRDPVPDPDGLDRLLAAATAFFPDCDDAATLSSWQGMRPRPVGQSAPVIQPVAGLSNALLATAHYRNGVLLAPATAQLAINWLASM